MRSHPLPHEDVVDDGAAAEDDAQSDDDRRDDGGGGLEVKEGVQDQTWRSQSCISWFEGRNNAI